MSKKINGIPTIYPCMMQKEDLWRVHAPHDEQPKPPSALRRLVTKLAAR